MSTPNLPVYVRYIGNESATEFSVTFPYIDKKYVKVYLVREGTDNPELLDETRYSFINDTTIQFPVKDDDALLGYNDALIILRRTDLGSDYDFDNQRRLFPEDVMDADDLSFHQIQELAYDVSRAIKVDITGKQTPDDLLKSIYDAADRADEAVGRANDKVFEAANHAETSRIWATGEDAEVETVAPGQDEHSSRGYADLAMAIANTPEDTPVDTSTLLALDVIRGPKGDDGTLGDGDITLQGTLTANSDANHPFVIEGMAGTSASGYQIIDSYGAGESDFEHFATGDRYGTRITNRSTATGKEVCVDLYQTNAGKSVLDSTDVDTVLVKDLQVNGKDVALDDNVVHKTGAEDISGIKTFKDKAVFNASSNEKIRLQSPTIDLDVNPSSQLSNQLWFVDKNNNYYATLQANQNTNGSVGFTLTMKSKTSNSWSSLGLTQFEDETGVATAPSTPSGSTTNQIVTADFFNRYAVQTSAISKTQNGHMTLSNGIIVQWGRTSTGSGTFTLPTPFTSTNYSVTFGQNDTAEHNINTTVTSKTTTSFSIVRGYASDWIAIGY